MRTCAPLVLLGLCPKLKYPPLCGGIFIDTNKAENGSLGKGFYFSGSKEYAKGHTISNGKFSGTVIETYLDAKNPYIAKYPGGIDTAKLMAEGNPDARFIRNARFTGCLTVAKRTVLRL